ncbi:MAG: hypothetical protein RLZZ336_853 [Cyanobacteriota bacterium]
MAGLGDTVIGVPQHLGPATPQVRHPLKWRALQHRLGESGVGPPSTAFPWLIR